MLTPISDWTPNVRAAALTILAGLFVTVVGGFYTLGYNLGAKDLEAVKDFKEKLPALQEKLSILAQDISNDAELKRNNKILNDQVSADKIENDRIKQDIKIKEENEQKLNSRISQLEAKIAIIFDKEVEDIGVDPGASATAMNGAIWVSVNNVYTDFATVTINGETFNTFHTGDIKTLKIVDRECWVRMTKITPPSTFQVSCTHKH